MAIPGIQEIQALATKYSKLQLQKMAQMGLVDPTKAVMAGMMIDRIQKQNMQMPQQTVADEVLGPPAMPQQMPPQMAQGVAGLPSGLPPQMAGGGIVAFADGGDIDNYADGGVVGYADRGLVDSRNDPAMRIDPRVQAERDRLSIPYLMKDLEYARSTGDPQVIAAAEREVRRRLGTRPNANIPLPFSEARAGERSKLAKTALSDVDYYQDPLGAPDYTTDGFSLKETVEYGKPYEPTVRGALFGYEQGKLPDITSPKKKEEKAAEAAPVPAPKVSEKKAPVEKKAEMGPAKPDMFTALRNIGIPEPDKLTPEQALEEQDRLYTQLGVDKDLFAKIRQDYERRRGKFADRAEKAAGYALMMFGAGLMGARRGQEFATAGKAAQQSLMMYMSSMDKLADQEDKLDQSLRELKVAEDQYRRTRADSALARVQKQQDRIDNIRLENAKLEMTAAVKGAEFNVDLIKNRNPAQYVLIERIAEASGKSPVEIFMMAQGIAKTGNLTLNQALEAVQRNTQFMGKTPSEQLQEAQRMTGASGGGGATYNYVPGKGLVPAQ